MSSYDEHLISMAGGDGEPDALDLDAIQARADAATEGPWDCIGGDVVQSYDIAVRTGEYSLECVGIIQSEHVRENDADFIAHARMDVPALLALVREQQARIERVKAAALIEGTSGEAAKYAAGFNAALEVVREMLEPKP